MGFDLMDAAWVGAGMLGSELVPTLVRKMWAGLPSVGIANYAVKIGGTLATAYAVKWATRSNRNFGLVMAGGIGLVMVDLFRQYVAPKIGLAGLGYDGGAVYPNELADVYGMDAYVDAAGVSGYVNTGLSGWQPNPEGAY